MNQKREAVDDELEAAIQRAMKLRIKMREIQDATGIDETVLWRWRNGTKPNWERRQHVLDTIDAMIKQAKDDYAQA